jgi:hypothetical protein
MERLPTGWLRDEQGDLYRLLTEGERASLRSETSSPESPRPAGLGSRPAAWAPSASRRRSVAIGWAAWLAALTALAGGLLAMLH